MKKLKKTLLSPQKLKPQQHKHGSPNDWAPAPLAAKATSCVVRFSMAAKAWKASAKCISQIGQLSSIYIYIYCIFFGEVQIMFFEIIFI